MKPTGVNKHKHIMAFIVMEVQLINYPCVLNSVPENMCNHCGVGSLCAAFFVVVLECGLLQTGNLKGEGTAEGQEGRKRLKEGRKEGREEDIVSLST